MEQFVEQLFHDPIFQRPESIVTVLLSLLTAMVFTLPVSWIYMLTARKDSYKPSLVQALIFLSVIVAASMLVIGNNLARAFGLVGATSIIRFRSKINNPKDIAYIFAAITIGMSSGLGLYSVGLVTSLTVNLLAFLFWKYNFAARQRDQEFVLSIKTKDLSYSMSPICEELKRVTDGCKLEKVSTGDGMMYQVEYRIRLNGKVSLDQILNTLRNSGKDSFISLECVASGNIGKSN